MSLTDEEFIDRIEGDNLNTSMQNGFLNMTEDERIPTIKLPNRVIHRV